MDERQQNEQPKSKCCSVKSMCGRSLLDGVVFVGIFSMVASAIILSLSVLSVSLLACSALLLNAHALRAMDLVFGLVSIALSVYQLVVTALLLWQALKTNGNIFLCSVWYVSHLSVLTLYGLFFCARVAVCVVQKRYFSAVATIIAGSAYEYLPTPCTCWNQTTFIRSSALQATLPTLLLSYQFKNLPAPSTVR